jgi:hypothetical protein
VRGGHVKVWESWCTFAKVEWSQKLKAMLTPTSSFVPSVVVVNIIIAATVVAAVGIDTVKDSEAPLWLRRSCKRSALRLGMLLIFSLRRPASVVSLSLVMMVAPLLVAPASSHYPCLACRHRLLVLLVIGIIIPILIVICIARQPVVLDLCFTSFFAPLQNVRRLGVSDDSLFQ